MSGFSKHLQQKLDGKILQWSVIVLFILMEEYWLVRVHVLATLYKYCTTNFAVFYIEITYFNKMVKILVLINL